MRLKTAILLMAVAAALAASGVQSQTYSNKPIRLIAPYPPGGGTDLIARVISDRLAERLGQSVVVDNRGGASTIIGAELAARAPADGYTLLVATVSTLAINPSLHSKLPYNPARDFEGVSMLVAQPYILAVNPSVPANSVVQLIAYAKANPGKLTVASAGYGTSSHLANEMFRQMAGVDIVHVPYKGTGPAMTDLLGGHVLLTFGAIATARPYTQSGKLRGLAVTTVKRSAAAPDLPTIAESGLPGYETNTWNSLVVPRGTPRPIVELLNAAVVGILNRPDVRDQLVQQGVDPDPGTPAQLDAHVKAETARFARLIKTVGLRPQ